MDTEDQLEARAVGLDERKAGCTNQDCLVVIYSPSSSNLGRRYFLSLPSISIGRGRDNDIMLRSESVSRRHARLEQRADGLYLVDLGSTNGTYVNEEPQPIAVRRLRRGDQISIGDTVLKFLSGVDVESQYHEVLRRMAITDGLTNLANRKQLDTVVAEEISRAQRHGRHLSLLILDIDRFECINDTYGSLTGDSVLRGLAASLQKRLRTHDKLGRYGGDEFCLVLPETSLSGAVRIAEELRVRVAVQPFVADDRSLPITISIGAAQLVPKMSVEQLYGAAEEMLQKAKREGRNRVCY